MLKTIVVVTMVTLAVVIGEIQIRGYFAVGGEMIVPLLTLVYLVWKEAENENAPR